MVMRIGLLGRGVGDAAYLAEQGANVLVVDDAPQEVMQPSVDALASYENIAFRFSPYQFADFKDADMVLVGAGAPWDEPVLVECREAGIPLKQSAALFAELSKIPIIGVTGTRGKSTVTELIHHVLTVVTGESIIKGGNIRGVSNLQLLKDVKPESLAVMELDSWQLQGWGWAGISPQIAVFTSFMPDHLNYYQRGDVSYEAAMARYLGDKAEIFRHQEESGVLITTPTVLEEIRTRLSGIEYGGELLLADASVLPEDMLLALPGEHNRLNAALAYEALKAVSLTDEEIFEAMASFPGLEGRLQLVTTIDHVRIYNDNNATTPAATIAALEALDLGNRNIVLIAGGADKQLDPAPLLPALAAHVKGLILLPGTGTDRLTALLREAEAAPCPWQEVASIEEAVAAARSQTANADIILFSPGFASFGLFKNEYERNDAFLQVVQPLEAEG